MKKKANSKDDYDGDDIEENHEESSDTYDLWLATYLSENSDDICDRVPFKKQQK